MQNVAVQLYYSGAWHQVEPEVFIDNQINIERGQRSAEQPAEPDAVDLRFNNITDKYRPSNPTSTLYGRAGRNTPLQVLVDSDPRATVEASTWEPGQTDDFRVSPARGLRWVDVQGKGVLDRIAQWKQRLRSPIYRAVKLSGVEPAEYWPTEDVNGSSQAVSAVGGAPMLPITYVRYTLPDGSPLPPGGAPQFGQGNGVPGSAALPSFQSGGTLAAAIRAASFNGYAVDWVMQFAAGTDAGGTTSADVLRWQESGTYVMFTVNVVKGSVTVFHANAADARTGASTGSCVAALDVYDGAPHHFRYQVRQNGGNYLAQMWIDGLFYATADNFIPGMTGTVGAPTSIQWNPEEDQGDYMPTAAGHLIIWASGQIGDQPPIFTAAGGHTGETAADRYARLMIEEGLAFVVIGDPAGSWPMGPQPVDTLDNLLQECARTEDGLIFDDRDQVRGKFRTRGSLYDQVPALELTYPTDVYPPFKEVIGGFTVANRVTVSQRGGGTFEKSLDSGPLGTQPPPDGVGEYKQTVEVNTASEQDDLPALSGWWLGRYTVDTPRFTAVTVNLTDRPDLAPDASAVDIGDRITITAYVEYIVDLIVIGISETIGSHTRKITYTCIPGRQFLTGIYDDTTRRYDSKTTTLNAAVTNSATTLVFKTTDPGDLWRPGGGGYDVLTSGEQITVPPGGMGAVTGTGPYLQTATGCTRSVNGVIKALSANEPIHVFNPARWAL